MGEILVEVVVEHDARDERQREQRGGLAQRGEENEAGEQHRETQCPHGAHADLACGNGALAAVAHVEPHIARVVQIHPADVEQRRAEADARQAIVAAAAEQPRGEAVRPDGGEIRDASEQEQRAPQWLARGGDGDGWRGVFGWGRLVHGAGGGNEISPVVGF